VTLPETAAAQKVGQLLATYLPSYWSESFWDQVGAKVIANRATIVAWCAELDADPRRIDTPRRPPPPDPVVPHRDRYDPDDVADDREDDRAREARQDEKARPGPRLGQ
jgi:hypothetical protein